MSEKKGDENHFPCGVASRICKCYLTGSRKLIEPMDLKDFYTLLVLRKNDNGNLLKEDDQKGSL